MTGRFNLWILVNTLIILARGQLKIPLDMGEWDNQLDDDIDTLFQIVDDINRFMGCYSIIAYTGNFDLRPSLAERIMNHFSVPVYTVSAKRRPLNRRYPEANNVVIALFSGLNDRTLDVLNEPELSNYFFCFLYVPPRDDNRLLTMAEMREFFTWCYEREFYRVILFFRGESEFETWSYNYSPNVTVRRLTKASSFENIIRRQGHRFLVQAVHDPPVIFVYNSSEQADVIGGGNISLSGSVGIMVVEFMRYINASMDILLIKKSQSSNYEMLELSSDRRIDMAANLVANDTYVYSPIVTDSQMCLVLPLHRQIPFDRYFDKAVSPFFHLFLLISAVVVFGVKYMAHRRRSVVATFFSTLRFALGIPLPGGQLNRLPLADKIMEVYSFLFVGIVLGAAVSVLSTVLTTGVYYPPIKDVESMRASGLRIQTDSPYIKQAFEDNRMPSSLADLVDVIDEQTLYKNFIDLNDNYTYVVSTPNWKGYQYYQQRMFNKRFAIPGPELCSSTQFLRVPISPHSPLRFIFADYFYKIFETGLQEKWLQMTFQKFCDIRGISKFPVDEATAWKPLNLDFFSVFIKVYIGGMLLSTFVFVIEILYKRYHG